MTAGGSGGAPGAADGVPPSSSLPRGDSGVRGYGHRHGLLAVGSGRLVMLYHVGLGQVVAAMAGHTDRVNAVAWVPAPMTVMDGDVAVGAVYGDEQELVSASTDGTVRVWRLTHHPAGRFVPWRCTATLTGHASSVTAVAAYTCHNGATCIASVGADCTLRVWWRSPPGDATTWHAIGVATVRAASVLEAVTMTQLPLPAGLRYADGITPGHGDGVRRLGQHGLLIAAGSVDCRAHLFTLSGDVATGHTDVVPALTMAGHPDWIRCCAFSHHGALAAHCAPSLLTVQPGPEAEGGHTPHVYLATAGQEGKTRLWRMTPKSVVSATAATAGGEGSGGAGRVAAVVEAGVDDDGHDGEEEEEEEGGGGGQSTYRDAPGSLLATSCASGSGAGGAMSVLLAADPVAQALQRPRSFTVGAWVTGASGASSPTVVWVSYEVVFDALLSGHDGIITSIQWHPPVAVRCHTAAHASAPSPPRPAWTLWQPPCCITASMDKSVAFWMPTGVGGEGGGAASDALPPSTAATWSASVEASVWGGVWERQFRVGSAGAAVAGLYGAHLSPDGCRLVAHAYQGALHAWTNDAVQAEDDGRWRQVATRPASHVALRLCDSVVEFMSTLQNHPASRRWDPVPTTSGHFGPVTCAVWGDEGRYLVTTSLDFTTRVWGQVDYACTPVQQVQRRGDGHGAEGDGRWCEIARPQIHGYEMVSAVVLPLPRLRHRLISAGDEKVVRVFDAPRLFVKALAAVATPYHLAAPPPPSPSSSSGPVSGASPSAAGGSGASVDWVARAEFAYVPELGLTNRAVLADGVGAPITDRMQVDGRDAESEGKGAAGGGGGRRAGGNGGQGGDGTGEVGGDGDGEVVRTSAVAPSPPVPPAPVAGGGVDSSKGRARVDAALEAMITTARGAQVEGLPMGRTPPPLEEDLVQHSRWPESEKMFGHANEVVCMAVNSAGTLLATACKARDEAAAVIWLWETASCRPVQVLKAHKLSVIALEFSPAPAGAVMHGCWSGLRDVVEVAGGGDSEFLVSASKDRSIALFGVAPHDHPDVVATSVLTAGGVGAVLGGLAPSNLSPGVTPIAKYRLLTVVENAHRRIIWGVSWAPTPSPAVLQGGDGEGGMVCFATGARDHVVRLWQVARVTTAATAPTAAPCTPSASGEERGDVRVALPVEAGCVELSCVGTVMEAATPVTAVAFAPLSKACATGEVAGRAYLLAVGEENGGMTLWRVCSHPNVDGGRQAWSWSWARVAAMAAGSEWGHVDTVHRLTWRPLHPAWLDDGDGKPVRRHSTLTLASVSADETVRMWCAPLALLG